MVISDLQSLLSTHEGFCIEGDLCWSIWIDSVLARAKARRSWFRLESPLLGLKTDSRDMHDPCFYKFIFSGEIVPKSRPKVTRNGTYFPRRHTNSQRSPVVQMRSQWKPCLYLTGKHSCRGDGDNILGAVLEALQSANIVNKDNLMRFPCHEFSLEHSKDPPSATLLLVPLFCC